MSSKQDLCWTEKWKEKYRRLRANGDSDGLRRLVFGRYVCEARGEKTQGEMAKLAKMERADWNRIENGHVLPPPARIPDIAIALGIENPATLFRKAGYAVPKKFATYDREEARRKFRKAIRESSTLAQFLIRMREVWQVYLLELRDNDAARARGKRLKLSSNEILSLVEKHLTVAQRLHLTRELINLSVDEVKAKRMNLRELYDDIGNALAKLETSKKLD
jgi:transcriptional regulator with XRE-family HTH domain